MKLLDIERIIYNGKKVNIPRRHNDAKYVHDKQQSCKICKVELIEVKNRWIHNYNWRLHILFQ